MGAMRAFISGTGSCLPEKRLTNSDLERIVETSDEWIVQRTGIRERRVASDGEATTHFGAEACRRAVEMAGLAPQDIDCLILASITPDTFIPSGAVHIQERLGLANAFAFDLNAACTGFVYGLAVARGLILGGTARHVLVSGAETLTRITDYRDRNSCILFGDGAGAAVVSAGEGSEGGDIVDCHLRSDGRLASLIEMEAGGARLPASHETVERRQHYMKMNGREVFKFAVTSLSEMMRRVVSSNGIGFDDLKLVIPHQVNQRIIDASLRRIGIPSEKLYLNLERYGNTSAASIPIALDEAVRTGAIERGDLICLVAFGAGMTWGYNLVRW